MTRARRRRAPRSTTPSSRSPRTTCARRATSCSTRTKATDGVDGRVSIEVAPGLAHDTDATIVAGEAAVGGGRPPQRVHQDPRDHRGPPGDHRRCSAQGISVNVTLIFGLDRYQRGDGRVPRRTGAGPGARASTCPRSTRSRRSSSPAWTPRSTSGSTRPAAAGRQLKGQAGIANARLAYQAYEEFFAGDRFAGAQGRRRQHPAAAVGLDRREEPGLPRHHVRRRPRRREHREHHAGEDPRGLRRPRRGRQRRPGHHQVRRRAAGHATGSPRSASTTTT